ncbi:MAG: DUF2179 domain-containing protein [Candidatus Aenigmarchaeota archaeon]|nr:DUF2179 domain-containing protein [Candidatus Aenigmarchaeota archaeon]
MAWGFVASPDFFSYIVLPILIFLARIVDVSMGTVRVIFISKGYKYIAPLIGFFEVIIWLLAITKIMDNLANPLCYLAYGAGFAAGTYAGMVIEERVSIGKVRLNIVAKRNVNKIMNEFDDAGMLFTSNDAEGRDGKVKSIFMVLERSQVGKVISIVKKHNPDAFYSIEEVRFAKEEKAKPLKHHRRRYLRFGFYRKGK